MGEKRIAGLDASRATMMILGVLLHSLIFSIFYIKIDSVSEFHAIMGSFFTIHTFRMPAFFFLAGFFSSLILERRGQSGFLMNRSKRLGLVFLIFAPTVAPLTFIASDSTQPFGLQHLWFIYYLLIISALFYLLTFLKVPDWLSKLQAKVGVWISDPRMLWCASLALFLIPGILDDSARIRTSESLIPDPSLLVFYGLFFALGVTLFKAGAFGLEALARRAPALLLIGLIAAQIAFGWGINDAVGFVNIFCAYVAAFYLAFGVIGIFLRFVKSENKVWTYLRSTSYWVYLVHLPIVFGLLRLCGEFKLQSFVAVPLTFLATMALSLLSYEILVRRTPLSKIV